MKLSICMMVKNESKYLDKCLKSLEPLRNAVESELIIVDTGSTDNTVEIAKKYTDKVYFHKWNNNFSEIRNITINYSTGEWFLCIDGDEIMYNPEEMISFLSSDLSQKYNSASVIIKNITNENNLKDAAVFSSVRLMKEYEGFSFKGAVHNQPIYKKPTYDLNTSFLHYGYVSTDKELMERKFKRTSAILKQELEKDPKNIYYWYQLSVSYSMHDEYDKATAPIEKAYKLVNSGKRNLKGYIYVYAQLALVYFTNKQYKKCENVCKKTIRIKDGLIDIYYYLSNAQGMLGKYDEAIVNYKNYLEILEKYNKGIAADKTITNYTMGRKDEVCRNLFVLYSKKEEYIKALEYAEKIENESMINLAMPDIINAFLKQQDYFGLKKYFENHFAYSKELKNRFYLVLEELIKNLKEEEKIALFKEFSDESGYGILSKVRVEILNNNFNMSTQLLNDINSLKFEDIDYYYGDIIYYLLKSKTDISKYIKIRENFFVRFIEYIAGKYKDINEVMYAYLSSYKSSDLNSIRINKILERALLILDKLDDNKYREIFYRFINDGVNYIKSVYSSEVIENEMIYDLKTDDEVFLLYIYKSQRVKNSDTKLYINYLKQALEAYPCMAKGIEILKTDLENELNPANNEFEQYKVQVKNTIKNLISNGDYDNAKSIINEYKKIVHDDIEIYSIEAVILILEGKLEEAEKVLKHGLSKNSNNFDLLFNLGYLYECKNNITEAKAVYNIAGMVDNNAESREALNSKMLQIGSLEPKYNVILFGSYSECLKFKERFNNWNVIAICSDKAEGEVIDVYELTKYDYDFIFVVEYLDKDKVYKKLGKYNKKNIYFIEDFKTSVIEGVDYKISKLFSKEEVCGIVTGLSYAEVGIQENLLQHNFINFAFSAQDLYYDFLLLKYLFQFEEVKRSLKYVIINLAYYSFDYDMSKTISKYRIHRYTNYFKEYHNNDDIIGVDITKAFYEERITFQDYVNMNKTKEKSILNINDQNGIYEARRNSSMNYKNTRYENEKVLDNYIHFLKENNIKPIIVICPTSFHYRKYFNNNKKTTFYNILNRINGKYNVQVIDHFKSRLFQDDDFWDYSHLNGKGSEKFTKILNEEIEW